MKNKISLIIVLAVTSITLLVGCKKDNSQSPFKDYFSVNIDGVKWDPAIITGNTMYSKIVISATSSNGLQAISLWLPETITVGTYSLTSASSFIAQYNASSSICMSADSGSIVITKHDISSSCIEGTFYFSASELVGSNSAILTNGSFGIIY